MLKALSQFMPRFERPIQPLVKSDRLDAYRARQITPSSPLPQRKSKRVRYDRYIRAKAADLERQFLESKARLDQLEAEGNGDTLEASTTNLKTFTLLMAFCKAQDVVNNLPRRRPMHNGRLPKLQRGRR